MRVLISLLLIPTIFVISFSYLMRHVDVSCEVYRTIVEIGGCDTVACGVRFSDGGFGSAREPVIGQEICVSRRREWK